jgi:hypothetical protein
MKFTQRFQVEETRVFEAGIIRADGSRHTQNVPSGMLLSFFLQNLKPGDTFFVTRTEDSA